MAIRTIRTWRWLVEAIQALLIIGLPFVRIKGESALRFDLSTLNLHVFGYNIWMQEFFLVLIAIIVLTILFIFITHVFGRVWCGWLCPQTVLVDFTACMDNARRKGALYAFGAYSLTLLVSVLVAASLIWYFVSPYTFIPALFAGTLGAVTWGFWITLSIILFLNFAFLRHKWCKTICPYAMLQSVLFDNSTLIIEVDPGRADECINCSRCLKVCPTEMDIRNGFDAACINCAECVDACNSIMARLQKKGLIRYAFGTGGHGRILRKNSLVLGGLTLLFTLFLTYLVTARTGVDVNVLPHRMEARTTKDNMVLNAYVLSVKNMLNVPVDLVVKVDAANAVQSLTEPIRLIPGGKDKLPLFVKIKKTPGMKTTRIRMRVSDMKKGIQIEREANFVIPDEL
ncbi:MAG TPA: 4Fe-4S dicluster domain-containing protein [Desulfuromonadaceae bacterium]